MENIKEPPNFTETEIIAERAGISARFPGKKYYYFTLYFVLTFFKALFLES